MQNWGHLFVQYQDHFKVYEPFIANQQRCNDVVSREWDKIRAAPLSPAFQGMVETQSVLGAFLLKPFQRLTKYPMLLNVSKNAF
jgi:cell division control protein 24